MTANTPASLQTGLGLVTAKFLGSRDRVLLGGNHAKTSCMQVHFFEHLNGIDGKADFHLKHDIHNDGSYITCMELCGIPRLMKTVAVVGGVDWNSRYGFVDLINLETKLTSASLAPLNAPEVIKRLRTTSTAITALAFNPSREVLVVGNEGGEVIIFDLYAETEICRIAADLTGIIALKFNASGQLVTIGNSSVNPAKVWDVRYGHKDEVLHNAMSMEVTSKSPRVHSSNSSPSKDAADSDGRVPSALTCLAVHPVHDRVICGGSTGMMSIWDLRTNATVQFNAHLSRVNDLLVHPRDHNQLISCSSDGTIKQTNSLKMPADTSDSHSTGGFGVFSSPQFRPSSLYGQGDESQTILSANYSITSMDCDEDSGLLLSTSEVGQVWRTMV